jgi:hypothetical protein
MHVKGRQDGGVKPQMHRLHGFEGEGGKRYPDGRSDRSANPTQGAEPLINAESPQQAEIPPNQHFQLLLKSVSSVQSVVNPSAVLG